MREDFLTVSLSELDASEVNFTNATPQSTVRDLLQALDEAVKNDFSIAPDEGNLLYWLLEGVRSRISTHDAIMAQRFMRLVVTVMKKDPEALRAALEAIIVAGDAQGQTFAYAWLNALYSATFDRRNESVIGAIDYVFNQVKDSTQEGITALLVTPLTEEAGSEADRCALLLLARALQQAASEAYNQGSALAIMKFVEAAYEASPDVVGSALLEPMSTEAFQGKSILYFLAGAGKHLAKDNKEATLRLCNLLCTLHQGTHQAAFVDALLKPIEVGPHAGLCTLHLILMSLLSAVYVKDNHQVIQAYTDLIDGLKATHGARINDVLAESVTMGLYPQQTTGQAVLEKALRVAAERDVSVRHRYALLVQDGRRDEDDLHTDTLNPSGTSDLS